MPNELKIVIDADIQKGVSGVKEFSRVVSGEFNKAIGSVSDLEKSISSSINKINSSLSGLKVTSVDVSVNTSQIDAGIKNIQSKFAALTDPKLNVLADTEQAEKSIKELIADLSELKSSKVFITANDEQALKTINEVEAGLNSLIGKKIDLSVSADLTRINDIKAKLDSLKVTPINVAVNTSEIEADINAIKTKFATLVDPKIDILANSAQAEKTIKELIADISTLKGSEIFIKANDTQALKVINEVESELRGILDKQIKIDVNSTGVADTAQRIRALEQQLINLEALKVSPDVSSTQLALFESNIQRIKAELVSLKSNGLVVPIGVDVVKAQAQVNILSESIETLVAKAEAKKIFITTETDITKIAAYNKEIQSLEARIRQLQNVGKKGFELFVVPGQTIQSVKNLSQAVAAFGGGVKTYIPPAISSFNKLPTSINQTATAFQRLNDPSRQATNALINLSRVAQDAPFGFIGIANNLNPLLESFQRLSAQAKATGTSVKTALLGALTGPAGIGLALGVGSSLLIAFGDDLLKLINPANEASEAIDKAFDSFDKNAGSITVMVSALKSNTLTTAETKKVQKELIDQAPEFQSAFKGNKIDVDELDRVMSTKYIPNLIKSIKVTAALGIVNEQLAKSIKQIAKGGEDFSFGQKITNFFSSFAGNTGGILAKAKNSVDNINDAFNDLKPESIQKLIENTFKSLGITFGDFAGTIDNKGDKIKKSFDSFQNEIISRAKLFAKEFGNAFVVPDLEESFFVGKNEIFKRAQKLLSDFSKGTLQIKLPVQVITELDFLPVDTPLTDTQLKDLTDRFFTGIKIEQNIPVEVIPDLTLAKGSLDKIDQKLDLKKRFSVLGKLGDIEFNKIDFTNINEGIAEATKRLQGMMDIATTLNQAIGQGLSSAFNAVFDSVLEGKDVFKALGQAIKELVVSTIKAIAQMLILKAITNLIFPGGGGVIQSILPRGFTPQANLGFGGIGSRAFNNVLQIQGTSTISGNDIVLSFNRANNSSGRFG